MCRPFLFDNLCGHYFNGGFFMDIGVKVLEVDVNEEFIGK